MTWPARPDGGWLVVERAAGSGAVSGDEAAILGWNGRLPPGLRLLLAAAPPFVRCRVDLVVEPGGDEAEVDRAGRLTDAVASMAVLETLGDGVATPASTPPQDAGDLAALCRETEWPLHERGAVLAVDLDVPGGAHQALVERRGDGTVAAAVPVLDAAMAVLPAASAAGRRAVAVLLLRTSGLVRLVRAAAPAADVAAARFEVVHRRPAPAELAHGFAALSVACRRAAAEALALWSDETVARRYLRDWDQARQPQHHHEEDHEHGTDGDDGTARERHGEPPDPAGTSGPPQLHDRGAAAAIDREDGARP